MKQAIVSIILISLSIMNPLSAQNKLNELLPNKLENWTANDSRIYTETDLYEYINGGAELYLSYGMKDVVSQLFTGQDGNEIRVEIFNMVEPKNAFGVFSHTRTATSQKFGQGSQYFTGAQIYWKDKYFISVVANDDNEEIRSAINALSKSIDSKIKTFGDLPSITSLLPETNIVKDGFVYFHHYIWLNSYFFLSNENILNITDETDGVLAKYGFDDHRHYLLLINYPTPEAASSALRNLKKEFKYPEDKSILETEDRLWQGAVRKESLLIAVFECKSEKMVNNLFNNVEILIKNNN